MTNAIATAALYDPKQVEEYLSMLFRNVDWNDGEVISLLGIGEKGTPQEGVFRERKIVPPAFIGAAHDHLRRWAEHQVAGFIVPAVLHKTALEKGDVTLDKVASLTALILDLDSGDTEAKAKFVTERLSTPSMVVASGGKTDTGAAKLHLYWLLNEPCEDVERVAALRKLLAAKVGGDQSFGRATQVVRVAGSVHAKNGLAAPCSILSRSPADYDLDDLAETIEGMLPMPGLPAPVAPQLPMLSPGMMDFRPKQDTAIAALHRDVHEGGEDVTRWSAFSQATGFLISEARAGRTSLNEAADKAHGWMLLHMIPPWPPARFQREFTALVNKDVAGHGAFPAPPRQWSNLAHDARLPLVHFADIKASLTNAWLVRKLLPLPGLAAIYGSPGAGKSFFALDLALRVAAGWSIDGRAVQQGPVVYVAAEGSSGLSGRVDAFRQHHAPPDLPFAMVPCAINLLDPRADLPRLIEAIEMAMERLGASPSLIIIDTLAATFGGGDENSNAMVSYVNNMAVLRDTFAALIAVVHHRPKDQSNDTLRGHGSLIGGVDAILRVDGNNIRTVTNTKQKDGEEDAPISFRLLSVPLGIDDEGEPVLSAVVDYVTVAMSKPLTGMAAAAFDALSDAIDHAEGGQVTESVWRARWTETLPVGMHDEAKRRAWSRAKASLNRSGRIQTEAGCWWVAPAAIDPVEAMNFNPLARAA